MSTAPSIAPFSGRASIADPIDELRRTRRWLLVAGVLSLLAGAVSQSLRRISSMSCPSPQPA